MVKCVQKHITTVRTGREIRLVSLQNHQKPLKMIKQIFKDSGILLSERILRTRSAEMGFMLPAIKETQFDAPNEAKKNSFC